MTRAVLLDALGTLLDLEPPWTHFDADGDPAIVEAAFRREMAYYREHAHEGRDEASLHGLRARCAALLSEDLAREVPVEEMMAAVRFHPFSDVRPALEGLRERGIARVVVSNWDCSLPEVLERSGLGDLIDAVLTSAGFGARKPDPAIFRAALERAGCAPGEAIHVGDSPREDRAGAEAAGIRAVLIDRGGGADIASLSELVSWL